MRWGQHSWIPKSRRAQVSKSVRMHHLAALLSKNSQQVKIVYKISAECTIYRPKYNIKMQQSRRYFHISRGRLAYLTPTLIKSKHVLLLISLQFQQCHNARIIVFVFKIVFANRFKYPRMHHLQFYFHFFLQFQIVSKPSQYTIYHPCFHFFHTVPNSKYCHNACFRYTVFIYFSAVLNCFKYHQNACFRYTVFIYFSAVLNGFKYRHNACFRYTFFYLFLCSSKWFQIPSQCMLQIHCFSLFVFEFFVVESLHYFKRELFFLAWQMLQNIKLFH